MSFKILIIGQGGREHAIAWNLSKHSEVDSIYVAPGNGGTFLEENVTNINIRSEDTESLIEFAKKNSINLTIVGPEAPLVDGIVDEFMKEGLKIFGPIKEHSKLEGSKVFAKLFLERNDISTAFYKSFSKNRDAKEFLKDQKFPIVVKADGLASGKGVIIAEDFDDACKAVDALLNEDGSKMVVIESFLTGIELSSIFICNDNNKVGLPWVKDYKSRDEYNSGPNTGGMGAVTHPLSFEHKNFVFKLNLAIQDIFKKTVTGINNETSSNYLGFLYIGLMIDNKGKANVLEYNCRFGDPETQNIMMLFNFKNWNLLDFITDNVELPPLSIERNLYACTIVLAAQGYPGNFKKNFFIDLSNIDESNHLKIIHAGTTISNQKIKVTGGRILSVNVIAESKDAAIKIAYENIEKIKAYEDEEFKKENNSLIFFRKDIGN
ncbi:MAG: phosphoribosylamine--glycine ligase [Pseudomonadota bacterium]|nr:phosphoribosylamine--glycine ligase [Pseudomonadota bacterium]